MGQPRAHRRGIAAAIVWIACLVLVPSLAVANPYGSPGSLSDAGSGSALGQSASMSADGAVAVIGQPNYNGGAGAALVYTNSDGTWQLAQRVTPSGEVGAGHFGAAVSMDNSGQALVVGAPDDNAGVGAAWGFALSDGTWSQQGELLGGPAETDAGKFGSSVAVANGGTIALVGAPMEDAGKGQVFTFYYDNVSGWYRFQRMDRAGVTGAAHFGSSVALSGNGSSGVVGAANASAGNGDVYPYTHFGLESPYWIDGTVIHSPAAGANFGASVAMSSVGADIYAGAPLAGGGDGAAYEYRPSGMQEATFANPSGASGGHFGASVSIAGDTMDELLVGAPGDGSGAGAAYDFDNANGGNWTTDGAALSPASTAQAGDAFGTAVAVSANGSNALVGAPGASSGDGAATHLISANITVPDPPYSVQAAAGVASADVSWGMPFSTGGSPITGYTATSSPGGLTCQTTTFFGCTISGLTPGQAYTFTVTAANSRGTSAASSPSDPVVPNADPSSGGGGGSPGGGGGGATGGGGDPSSGGTTPSGGGAGSNPTPPKPAPTVPRPSGSVMAAKVTRSSMTLSWGAAAGAAGYRVYEYVRGNWKLVGSSKTRSFACRGLHRKSRYRFEVRAFDSAGNTSAPLVGHWFRTRA